MKTTFLPIGLILALLSAVVFSDFGIKLAEFKLNPYLISAIFFMNGYDFLFKDIIFNKKLIVHIVVISLISLIVSPILAFIIHQIIQLDFDWLIGFYTIACVPTTLSSGIVIASQAGGNKSLAVLLTILISFLGVFTLPISLGYLLKEFQQIDFFVLEMMLSLCYKVLIPFVFGYVFHKLKPSSFKFGSYLPSLIVIFLVFLSASKSSYLFTSLSISKLVIAIAVSGLLHLVLMMIIYAYSKASRTSLSERYTFLFCGSQKTLPLSVAVLASLKVSTGLALVLCISFHFIQLMFDSILASVLSKQSKKLSV